MKIEAARFAQAVTHRNSDRIGGPKGGFKRASLSPKTKSFFEKHGLPAKLRTFLGKHSYDRPIGLGNLIFERVNGLPTENLAEHNRCCLAAGLLVVGSGLNGDPIVVDLQNELHVGFVKHDALWGMGDVDARDLLSDSGLDLGTFFLAAAVEEETFPRDAYDAEELTARQWKRYMKPRQKA